MFVSWVEFTTKKAGRDGRESISKFPTAAKPSREGQSMRKRMHGGTDCGTAQHSGTAQRREIVLEERL
jgi:hypothetical protein